MDLSMKYKWDAPPVGVFISKSYICGYCGNALASEKGYHASSIEAYQNEHREAFIYICHHCTRPTFFDASGIQSPGTPFGNNVNDITDESVLTLYNEARKSISASCHTAAVLCCRKLLMHIAVSKGADEGKPFSYYVNYLSEKNFVPPDAKQWVDHIREKGNEANHEINIMESDDSQELVEFSEMLLKLIYEFPSKMKKKCKTSE
jgi:hypothetical protein